MEARRIMRDTRPDYPPEFDEPDPMDAIEDLRGELDRLRRQLSELQNRYNESITKIADRNRTISAMRSAIEAQAAELTTRAREDRCLHRAGHSGQHSFEAEPRYRAKMIGKRDR